MNRCPKRGRLTPPTADDLIDSKNILLAGTSMVSGQAKAVVFATGMHTEFGKIAHLTQTAGEEVSPLRKEIAHLSRLTAILAVLIGLLFFSLGWMIGIPFWKDFIFAIGIIVAMVPEGLLPTLTLALVLATQRMAKRNVLIRYLPSVETLGSTTVICTDKTGTLTQNRMVVRQLYLGETFDSPDRIQQKPGLADLLPAFFPGSPDVPRSEGNGRVTERAAFLGDPMEVALVEMARALHFRYSRLSSVGRNPVRRRPHAAVHRAPSARRPCPLLQGRARVSASSLPAHSH